MRRRPPVFFHMIGEDTPVKLKDPSLFRQAALVGETWIEADPP